LPYPRKKRPRGVVDTSVLVAGIAAFKQQGAQSSVPSAQFLRDWIDNDTFVWLISEEIVDEYKEILARRGVRPQLIGTTINLIRSQAEDVPEAAGNEVSPNPDDEPFCTCAEMGNVDFIVPLNPADFPQQRLRAHVILPGEPVPTTARTRPR
jgi:predicted nucleic acid-binding protein